MVDRVKAHQASELVAVTVMQLESKFKLTEQNLRFSAIDFVETEVAG